MLELDKFGKFWRLDGTIIEPWEITKKWAEIVNAAEAMAGKLKTEQLYYKSLAEHVKAHEADLVNEIAAQTTLLRDVSTFLAHFADLNPQWEELQVLLSRLEAAVKEKP